MLLNLRQLEIFRAIMMTKTIIGAAELLKISQPAVSKALKYIEQRLNIELFERTKGRLIATPEAEELALEFKHIYKKMDKLDWTLERITSKNTLLVRLASPPSLVRYILPNILTQMRAKLPTTSVQIDAISNEELADYICEHKGCCAISFYDPKHPLVSAQKVFEGNMICALPKDHRLASKSSIDLDELADEHFITYHSDTAHGRLVLQLLKQAGIKYKASISVRYNGDACAMVEQGLGVALVSSFVTMGDTYPKIKTVPLNQKARIEVYLLRHKEVALSQTNRSFLEHLENTLNDFSKTLKEAL